MPQSNICWFTHECYMEDAMIHDVVLCALVIPLDLDRAQIVMLHTARACPDLIMPCPEDVYYLFLLG